MNKELNVKFKFDNSDNSIYFIQNYIDNNDELIKELSSKNLIPWHTHALIENPESIFLFNEVINKILNDFNVNPLKIRVNYMEKNTIKDYHKDFYKQDFTIVLNLHPGHILFKHDITENIIKFLVEANTLYIFDKTVNQFWSHRAETLGLDRLSIIIWCIKK